MAHRKFVDLAINSMVIFQVAILHNQRVNWVIVPLCPHYVLNYVKNHCWWISIPWSSNETSIWSSRVAHLPCAVLWAIPFDPGGPWQGSSVWLSPQFFHRQEDFLSWGCLLEAQEMCGLWLEIVYIYMCVAIYIYIYVYVCLDNEWYFTVNPTADLFGPVFSAGNSTKFHDLNRFISFRWANIMAHWPILIPCQTYS